MKKILVIILTIILGFSLFTCGTDDIENTDEAEIKFSGDLSYYLNLIKEMDKPDKELEDKLLQVTGEYTDEFLGNYYIGEMSDEMYCCISFDEKTEKVKELQEGDVITVTGLCIDADENSFQIIDATLEKVIKKEAVKPTQTKKADAVITCDVCGSKEHKSHPTCGTCGSTSHITHPTCETCGSTSHETHPTCVTCGSTSHITHPESNTNSNQIQDGSGQSGSGITIPDAETQGNLVWIPVNGGTKYHNKSSCSKMIDPIQVSVETAQANGFTACGRCY